MKRGFFASLLIAVLLVPRLWGITGLNRDELNLLRAVKVGNLGVVQVLVRKGTNVNIQDDEGKSPLIMALEEQYPEIVNYLLDRPDTDVSFIDDNFNSAIMLALKHAPYEVIERILNKIEIDVNIQNLNEETPLMYASMRGDLGLVTMIIEKGADVNARDRKGASALFYAAGATDADSLAVVRYLVKNNADTKAFDRDGYGVLDYVCPNPRVETFLKRQGVKAKKSNPKRLSADEIIDTDDYIIIF